ncbi:MAG TPA: hypothetical protein VJS44_08515 [Pyrinomonadaceae bacterium]|nr:hypothetical protein [Pyrinomonadaceae bacterium]
MSTQSLLFENSHRAGTNPSDVVYTPEPLAWAIVEAFKPSGKCLEPCKGAGAFLRYLPEGSDWCEIAEGRDFFDYHKRVDWIVSNPPHSIFDKWLAHSFEIAENVVYLLPFSKAFKSWGTLQQIKDYGGIVRVIAMPSSRAAGFPFGYPLGAFHFKRHYEGATLIEMWE